MVLNIVKRLYFFNQYERDRWVQAQANTIPAGKRVLDVGAGSCPYRSAFSHCDYRTHDFGKLEENQLRGRVGYGAVDYVGDICSIPVEDASFDVILCTEVLEHVPEPIRAVQEFSRILRPGGYLILTAPLGSGLHQEPYHFYGGYTPFWYQRFLDAAGFESIKIEQNRGFFSHYGQEAVRCARMLAPWTGTFKLLLLPIWIIIIPSALIVPITSVYLDRTEYPSQFTVGYHVTARKR